MRGWIVPWIVLVVGTTSVDASAQEPWPSRPARTANEDAVDRARELFVRGAGLVRDQRWADALPLLEQSAKLHPHATTAYNIAYCERVLEHLTRAQLYFRRALAENEARGAKELAPELVASARNYLVELDARIAIPRITLPDDVAIAIDGRPLKRSKEEPNGPRFVAGTRELGAAESVGQKRFELVIDPGHHSILVRTNDGRYQTTEVDLAPQSAREIVLDAPAPVRSEPPPPSADTSAGNSRRIWALGVGGAGVAMLAVGTVFLVNASSSWSDAQAACPDRSTCPDDRGADLSSTARLEGNLATAAFVTGVSALVGAAVLWLTAPRADYFRQRYSRP